MRILVTGREGQVATALAEKAGQKPGVTLITMGRPELDLERPETVGPAIAAAKPDLIVNAAAYTAVDKAEQDEGRAFAVNRDGAGAVATASQRLGIPLIHLSTDYVYDGTKPSPYLETDPTAPLGVYGRSKLGGEEAVLAAHHHALILRTSWVYSPFGNNFVKTMLRLGREREELRVVDDQLGSPTSALDIADALLRIAPTMIKEPKAGHVRHLCGSGEVTWCGFARHIFAVSKEMRGPSPRVAAIPTSAYPTPARRPMNSRLSMEGFAREFGFVLPPWQDSVSETVRRLLQ